ncbi:MAG TPA: hypothetical protein DD643_06060 [Synechococcus sp. UBA8638]|uniref:hypothetical protein n=1 Tax=Candidatus Synechococcus spongiarum TaxID=431041 RepID=UPI000470CD5B|nr:hypothetical protein [Candidatus Synechococcus spongiarum]HBP53916.1 hypothetical protein [Synechococcus sp. UBA8638]
MDRVEKLILGQVQQQVKQLLDEGYELLEFLDLLEKEQQLESLFNDVNTGQEDQFVQWARLRYEVDYRLRYEVDNSVEQEKLEKWKSSVQELAHLKWQQDQLEQQENQQSAAQEKQSEVAKKILQKLELRDQFPSGFLIIEIKLEELYRLQCNLVKKGKQEEMENFEQLYKLWQEKREELLESQELQFDGRRRPVQELELDELRELWQTWDGELQKLRQKWVEYQDLRRQAGKEEMENPALDQLEHQDQQIKLKLHQMESLQRLREWQSDHLS